MHGKKKKVILHPLAEEEYKKLDLNVQEYFRSIINVLEIKGELREPEGKKIRGYKNIFEIRVRIEGSWRGFYGYLKNDLILLVHFMQKKKQKTDLKTLNLVLKRLKDHE